MKHTIIIIFSILNSSIISASNKFEYRLDSIIQNNYEGKFMYVFKYDSEGRTIEYNKYSYRGNNAEHNQRTVISYDSTGNIIQKLVYEDAGVIGHVDMRLMATHTYTYNDSKLIEENCRFESWARNSNIMTRERYEYNSDRLITKKILEVFNDNTWMPKRKQVNSYENALCMISTTESFNDNGTVSTLTIRHDYDISKRMKESITITSHDTIKNSFNYNDEGVLTSITRQYPGDNHDILERHEITYDQNHNICCIHFLHATKEDDADEIFWEHFKTTTYIHELTVDINDVMGYENICYAQSPYSELTIPEYSPTNILLRKHIPNMQQPTKDEYAQVYISLIK